MTAAAIFDRLSLKAGQLLYGTHTVKGQDVFQVLDELNCLNFCLPIVLNHTKAVLLINQICTSVDPDDDRLAPKCLQLITKLVTMQNVLVAGKTLPLSIRWCLQAAKGLALDALPALEALIRNNAHNVPLLLASIVKQILDRLPPVDPSIKPREESQDLVLAGYGCLEASTRIPTNVEPSKCLDDHFKTCQGIFTHYLCSNPGIDGSVTGNKIVEICLVGLDNLTAIQAEPLHRELGLVLGVVKSYMVYGLKGVEFLKPVKITPTVLNVPETEKKASKTAGERLPRRPKYRSTTKKKEKRAEEDAHFGGKSDRYTPATISLDYSSDVGPLASSSGRGFKTSDSDFSDAEGGRKTNSGYSCSRVRQAALALFSSAIKHEDNATIFTYWSSFIPEGPTSGKHHLVSCCLLDPTKRGKVAALSVLLNLISRTKMYLVSAESRQQTASFTSFSVMLGLTLTELNSKLCLALYDNSLAVLIHALKCLAVLVQATPYHRLAPGLISKIVRNVKPLASSGNCEVQVTALVVLGCLLVIKPPLLEAQQAILKMPEEVQRGEPESPPASEGEYFAQFSSDEEEEEVGAGSADSMSWLLHKCLKNLGVVFEGKATNKVAASVKMESLQVLSAMSRIYFEPMMLMHLGQIVRGLELSLASGNDDLALHAGRTIDFLGDAIGKLDETAGTTQSLSFWQTLLNGPLVGLIQSDNPTLRSVGCDCVASIAPRIWEQLPRHKQLLCVTLLFGCAKDEQGSVRGAAARALSICVLCQSLREDHGFVVDTAEAILHVFQDSNAHVRTKASWSLSTLSDALVLIHNAHDEGLPDKILLKLLEISVESLNNSNDKIKPNVGRTMGNLLQLLEDRLLENEPIQRTAGQAIEALVKACGTSGSNVKVRWNACYALASALRNPALYRGLAPSNWQARVFSTLTELVVGFKNFKVRINAALALSAPGCREHYGAFFIPVWTSMLQALEHSQNIDDFSEYKHRDQLVEQICLGLGHLVTLMTRDDLSQVDESLPTALDMLTTQVRRVLDRLVPEKSSGLIAATCALNALEEGADGMNAGERRVVQCLRSVFV